MDRHLKKWRPTLRPDRALFERVARGVDQLGGGWTMNSHYEAWLRYCAHERDEPPPRPPAPPPADDSPD
ncbi:hypothetical protein [Actinomadura sp. 3N508]|uniref:hypothetical protein n=1 Tax=Actinomadura sp. 3N508 TaxID=3375153 RepID=UPI0037C17281